VEEGIDDDVYNLSVQERKKKKKFFVTNSFICCVNIRDNNKHAPPLCFSLRAEDDAH